MRAEERQLNRHTQIGRALGLLQRIADRPVRAIELAETCDVSGITNETKRRRVREMIERMHELGHRVCASSGAPENCGYWLAKNPEEWAPYLEARKSGAKFEFVAAARMQAAATDRINEQAGLFGETLGSESASETKARNTAWAMA